MIRRGSETWFVIIQVAAYEYYNIVGTYKSGASSLQLY